jgi:two-component system cell cycle sensor histidine kinase/response regulator CckA
MASERRDGAASAVEPERLFRWMIERAPAIFWTTDRELRVTSGYGGGLATLDPIPVEVVGQTLQTYLGTSDPESPAVAAHLKALAGEASRYELAWGGQIYQSRVEPLHGDDGEITGVVGLALDVTEARRSSLVERALFRVSEEAEGARDLPAFFAALHSIVGELMYAGNFYLALVDEAAGQLSFPYFVDEIDPPPAPRPLGRGLTEYVLRTGEALLAPSSVDALLVAKGEVDEVGAPAVDWLGVPLKHDGRTFGVVAVQSYREGVRFGERDKEVLTFVARHIAAAYERRTANEGRERMLQLLRATLESTADGILVVDDKGEVVTANQRFVEMWRIPGELMASRNDPSLLAFVLDQLVDPESFLAKVRELYEDPQATVFDVLEFRDGRTFERYSHATSIGGSSLRVWSFRDVTERKKATAALDASQQELRQAQKMEALGRMAGGIAHDFNNLLTVVSGYSDLAAARLTASDSPLRNDIEAIRKAARRAAELTSQLLAVGRRQPVMPRILNLNELVVGLESWLRRLIGEDVELLLELHSGLWNVRADPGQLEQVVLNLVVNARDAMPRGGTLTLATANHEIDDTLTRPRLGVGLGSFVRLEVRDTGIGMDTATAERIFEPFFTTKERGKGTGLGLSTLYGIVSQNGGFVEVDTVLGRGSSFQVCLPKADGETTRAEDESRLAAKGGGETILLVEDDTAVRTFLVEFLRSQGYRLLEARDGREALAVAAIAEPIDVLVTDIVMPQLGGIEVAGRLRADRPDLPVLLLTGYAETLTDTVHQPGIRLLAKPVAADLLARTLREMLDVNRTLF